MKKTVIRSSLIILTTLNAISLHGNTNVPTFFEGFIRYKILLLMIISVTIQALLIHKFIKTVSYPKSFLMSFVGNAATLIGPALIALAVALNIEMILMLMLLTAISHIYIIAMWALNSFVELIVLRLIFGYKSDQLLPPILIGNIMTYLTAALYFYLGP